MLLKDEPNPVYSFKIAFGFYNLRKYEEAKEAAFEAQSSIGQIEVVDQQKIKQLKGRILFLRARILVDGF